MARRAQIWSMDLVIAVLIFLVAVGIFYYFLQAPGEKSQTQLRVEAETVAETLVGSDAGLAEAADLDEADLQRLSRQAATDYASVQRELGLKDDFCVVLIDKDGNLLLIGNGTENYAGFGNGNLTLNLTAENKALPCGSLY